MTRWHSLLVREAAHIEISRVRTWHTEHIAREIIAGNNEVLAQRAITHNSMPRNCGAIKAFAEMVETLPFDSHNDLYALCQRLILDEAVDRQKILTNSVTFAAVVIANNQDITKPDDYTIDHAREALEGIVDIRQRAADYLSAHVDLDPGEYYIKTKYQA